MSESEHSRTKITRGMMQPAVSMLNEKGGKREGYTCEGPDDAGVVSVTYISARVRNLTDETKGVR